jgi:hypothetical protein
LVRGGGLSDVEFGIGALRPVRFSDIDVIGASRFCIFILGNSSGLHDLEINFIQNLIIILVLI